MQNLKYGFALLCVGYIVSAVLPGCQPNIHHCPAPTMYSAWLSRVLFVLDSLLFGAAFLCMQLRKPICWKLIPALLGTYWLTYILPGFFFPLGIPNAWMPELAVAIITIVGVPVFAFWWRKQKGYFAAR